MGSQAGPIHAPLRSSPMAAPSAASAGRSATMWSSGQPRRTNVTATRPWCPGAGPRRPLRRQTQIDSSSGTRTRRSVRECYGRAGAGAGVRSEAPASARGQGRASRCGRRQVEPGSVGSVGGERRSVAGAPAPGWARRWEAASGVVRADGHPGVRAGGAPPAHRSRREMGRATAQARAAVAVTGGPSTTADDSASTISFSNHRTHRTRSSGRRMMPPTSWPAPVSERSTMHD